MHKQANQRCFGLHRGNGGACQEMAEGFFSVNGYDVSMV